MFNLDVSKLVPIRFYYYIAPVFPGLFFEISVALANPELSRHLVARIEQGLWSGHYLTILISLFVAFAVGFGAIMFVSLLTWILSFIRGFLAFSWGKSCAHVLLPLITSLFRKRPSWQRQRWLQKLQRYLFSQAFPDDHEFREVSQCWRTFASELLVQRYRLERMDALRLEDSDWRVLYWTLAMPTREELTPSITMVACHAAGWCGLAAVHFAPALTSRWYLAFSSLLIASGLISDYYDTRRRTTPEGRGYINVRALLREFPKAGKNDP